MSVPVAGLPVPSIEIASSRWWLVDPFATQDRGFTGVPAAPGLYLWLCRDRPGPDGVATERVLYAGKASDLRKRLHGYSSVTYPREDPVLRALFDRVVAPGLSDRDLRDVVESRRAPGLAQMWIRDHVWFAWQEREKESLSAGERELIAELRPQFNAPGSGWTRYESTGHGDHDLTLPIVP